MPSPKLWISAWGGGWASWGRRFGEGISSNLRLKCHRSNRLASYSSRRHSQEEDLRRPSEAPSQGDHSNHIHLESDPDGAVNSLSSQGPK